MVSVNLQMFKHTTKPKLFWKFNNQLLKGENFTTKVKKQIAEVKREYVEPRPNAANDLDITNNEYKSYLGPQLFLEVLLLKTRELAIKVSTALKNMKSNKRTGTDGFSVEFYKFFWTDLGVFVVKSLNEGFTKKLIIL